MGHSMSYFVKEQIIEDVGKPKELLNNVNGETARLTEAAAADIHGKKGDEGDLFFGEAEEEDIDLEEESPEYLKAKRKLFLEPVQRLEAKPLRLTLEDCIRIALVNNNKIQATEYGIDAAKAKYDEANMRFWPIFEYRWLTAPIPGNLSDALGSFFSGDIVWWHKITVQMGVPVYAFGKMKLAKDIANSGITAARENRRKEKLSVVTNVRQLYYGVLLAEELGKLLVKAYEKLSKEIESGNRSGRSPVERAKARIFLVELENRIAEARNKEILAIEGLRVQMGLNPDVAVMVYSERLKPVRTTLRPIEDYLKSAMERRPDIKLVEAGLEIQRRRYQLEKRKYLPDIGIGAYMDIGRTIGNVRGVTTTDNWSDPVNFYKAGIGMQVEGKFDIHGQMARVKNARSEYYKTSLEHYMAKDGAQLDVKKAYIEAETALDDIRRADIAQKYARQLMFLTQSNFELGIGDEQEYIDALQLVLLTRGKYFESIFNYNVALAVLDEKAGIIPEVDIYH